MASKDTTATPTPAADTALDLTPVAVRVLTVCSYGNANDVAVMPACEVAAARADGLVDDNPAAVAYARAVAAEAAQAAQA